MDRFRSPCSRTLLRVACAIAIFRCAAALPAQSVTDRLQVHGFATQSIVYSNGSNYLGMDTTSGSLDWTEAAVNLNGQLSNRLRIGVQVHVTKFGAFGSYVPTVDWAIAD